MSLTKSMTSQSRKAALSALAVAGTVAIAYSAMTLGLAPTIAATVAFIPSFVLAGATAAAICVKYEGAGGGPLACTAWLATALVGSAMVVAAGPTVVGGALAGALSGGLIGHVYGHLDLF
jgi:hypothetical protein